MTPTISTKALPCPDSECVDGYILVHNAYSPDPLKGERQKCDVCGGTGYIISSQTIED